MKLLNGAELAGFIQERQAHQVRGLRQAHNIYPKLVVISCGDDLASKRYVSLKQAYGADILIDVEHENIEESKVVGRIKELNADSSVHGIIVQLPLPNPAQTDEIVATIDPKKDVDALGPQSIFDAATPLAINWLLSGYNVQLAGKNIVLVGQGRLVGAPLKKMLEDSGLKPTIIDEDTPNSADILKTADIIISAVGKPGLITSNMIPHGAVVVDAGVASEEGVLKGDIATEVYETRDDLTITPQKGGVGPLTVAALFDNVIRAARES